MYGMAKYSLNFYNDISKLLFYSLAFISLIIDKNYPSKFMNVVELYFKASNYYMIKLYENNLMVYA